MVDVVEEGPCCMVLNEVDEDAINVVSMRKISKTRSGQLGCQSVTVVCEQGEMMGRR